MRETQRSGASARWFLLLLAGGLLIAWLFPDSPLVGDPTRYRERMESLFAGRVPYVEGAFEHYPLTLIPMAVAWLLGGFGSDGAYRVAFAGLMAVCLWGTLVVDGRVGDRVGISGAGLRWLAIAAPLFPLVLFRSDPWSVLLADVALLGLLVGRGMVGGGAVALAAAAKGWPVVLSAVDWWHGHRLRAVVTSIGVLVLTVWLWMTPGFRLGREPGTIHAETTVGGLVGLWRAVRGEDLQVAGEIAAYIAVPPWLAVAAAVATMGLLIFSARALRKPFSWPIAVTLPGVLVLAVLVGSPLLSAQYLLWPTPFIAFHPARRVRIQMGIVNALTIISVMVWPAIVTQPISYFGLISVRNMLLFALAFDAALLADRGSPDRRIDVPPHS